MIKKLAILPLIGLFLVPFQSVQALSMIQSDESDVFENLSNVESVDFSIDIDFETKSSNMERPLTMHADIDGIWDTEDTGEFDLNFWSNDSDGEYSQYDASAVMSPEYIYISDATDQWYFIEQVIDEYSSDEEVEQIVLDLSGSFQELIDNGVIKYDPETVEYINKKLTVRFAYELDTDNLVDYLIAEGLFTDEESNEMRTYLNDHLAVNGYLWLDTKEMLPVMLTMNIGNNGDEDSYTNFKLSILFNSFNELVEVEIPENAISLDEYNDDEVGNLVMSSIEKTATSLDMDADGLTDDEEKEWNTNKLSSDSDGDGFDDNIEIVNGYNPNGSGKLDTDGDRLPDYFEITIHWSDPNNADTDGDGYNDGLEVANGYDPNGPGRF